MKLSIVKITQSLNDRIELLDEKGNTVATMKTEDYDLAKIIVDAVNNYGGVNNRDESRFNKG